MTGGRRAFAIGFVFTLAIAAAVFTLRPHVARHWALYLGTPQQMGAAHLFLDPFPNAYSCETRVKVFAANAERAFCKSRYEFELGSASDALLAADFNPFSPAAWFCLPRWAVAFSEARTRRVPSRSQNRR